VPHSTVIALNDIDPSILFESDIIIADGRRVQLSHQCPAATNSLALHRSGAVPSKFLGLLRSSDLVDGSAAPFPLIDYCTATPGLSLRELGAHTIALAGLSIDRPLRKLALLCYPPWPVTETRPCDRPLGRALAGDQDAIQCAPGRTAFASCRAAGNQCQGEAFVQALPGTHPHLLCMGNNDDGSLPQAGIVL
jgi:hypothetical protein